MDDHGFQMCCLLTWMCWFNNFRTITDVFFLKKGSAFSSCVMHLLRLRWFRR